MFSSISVITRHGMISHVFLRHKVGVHLELFLQRQREETLSLLKDVFCQFGIKSLREDRWSAVAQVGE